jgi:hypothetical protein
MKASPSNPDPHDSQGDANDPIWRLLARAPRPEPDAWFAARTLARCRHEGLGMESGVGAFVRFGRMWRWALGGGLAFSMALVLVVMQINSAKVDGADNQKNVQEAFEIMASIDTDSDSSSSSSSWQDSSL